MSTATGIKEWQKSPMYEAPGDTNIAEVQKEIDLICGVTTDNQSTVKLVWSGDRNYWFDTYNDWDALGKERGGVFKRPLLYITSVIKDGKVIQDVFPPRWLLLSRFEPHQYAHSWENDSYKTGEIFTHFNAVGKPVYQTTKYLWRPKEAPKVWYDVLAGVGVICEHKGCCKPGEMCYGIYTSAQAALPMLRRIREQIAKTGFKAKSAFISADKITETAKPHLTNYDSQVEQLVKLERQVEENPLSVFPSYRLPQFGSLDEIKKAAKDYFNYRKDKGVVTQKI
jgi:hypothetical protein